MAGAGGATAGGTGRSKSAEKDPAEQPQPEVAVADEPAAEDAGEGANV